MCTRLTAARARITFQPICFARQNHKKTQGMGALLEDEAGKMRTRL